MKLKLNVNYYLIVFQLSFLSIKAQQRPRIIEHPADAVAAREEPLTLNCKATGRPTPEITWYHNGTPLIPSERRVILPEGALFFLRVTQNKKEQDAGVYWCEAKSPAGVSTSHNATLQIAILRDDFRLTPNDTVASVGGTVVLKCTPPRGIPEPSVLWYKDGKILELNGKRISLVDSGSIMITDVKVTDGGKYECSAQSMAGVRTAPPAMLKVLIPPTIIKRPQDTEVIESEGIDLPCEIIGDPKPIVSWYRDGKSLPEGRSRILLDNTLRIEDVHFEDQGQYICTGKNEGGNISVAIKLFVYAIPVFVEAPTDSEVIEGNSIRIPCRAQGRPKIRIIWEQLSDTDNPSKLSYNNKQVTITPNENKLNEQLAENMELLNLRSKRLSQKEILVNSSLVNKFNNNNINNNNNNNNIFNKRHKRGTYHDNNKNFQNVEDEYEKKTTHLKDDEEITNTNQNVVVTDGSSIEISENDELIIRNATENHQGWYACAALNEAGSIVRKIFLRVIHLTGETETTLNTQLPTSRWESEQNIIINSVLTASATELKVSFDTSDETIIPLKLYYRMIGTKNFQNIKVSSTELDKKQYTLNNLKAYTKYEVFATTFQGLNGSVSNIRIGKTMDGPPSSPPTDVRIGIINNTAAYVRWSPPPTEELNGELTGYKIQIKSNTTNKLLGQMSLNATTQSVVINSLSPGGRYIARVSSLTAGGIGPYSSPVPLHMDPSYIIRPPRTDSTINGWTSVWMSGIAFGILGICLVGSAILTVWWARKNKRNFKPAYPKGPVISTEVSEKHHTLWLHSDSLVSKPTHFISAPLSNQTSEYAEVAPSLPPHATNNIINSTPPEPYATVTLKRGVTPNLDDNCTNCVSSSSSSEYNVVLREQPVKNCDIPPPSPPLNMFNNYKPPNNMTIRTNPAALSPQILKKVSHPTAGWSTLPPPIPNFPQNWVQHKHQQNNFDNNQEIYSETDYESGSVLYEPCCQTFENSYFNVGGDPTEEYYRNVNMEFYNDQRYEPSTPPPPCPDPSYNNRPNINNDFRTTNLINNKPINSMYKRRNNYTTIDGNSDKLILGNHNMNRMNLSSDESDSDNSKWAPRYKTSRNRSKISDKKFYNENGQVR